MTWCNMTHELYYTSLKYKKTFKYLTIELKMKNFEAIKLLMEEWRKDKVSCGFSKNYCQVMFMVSLPEKRYHDKKTGELLSEKKIKRQGFISRGYEHFNKERFEELFFN